MSRCPENAEDPKRLLPKRAPSSSAQSTRRTVTGGRGPYWAWIRRRISSPARTFRHPSSQPPLGTESMCPPIRSAWSDSPGSVAHRLAAWSAWTSTGSPSSFFRSHCLVSTQVRVNATLCAPFSSAVKLRSSFSSSIVRRGSTCAIIFAFLVDATRSKGLPSAKSRIYSTRHGVCFIWVF